MPIRGLPACRRRFILSLSLGGGIMRIARFPVALPLAAALISLSLTRCTDRHDLATGPPVAVESPSGNAAQAAPPDAQPGFYPLATGNRWSYTQEAFAQLINVPDPPPPERYTLYSNVEIIGPATFDGRDYLGEQTI